MEFDAPFWALVSLVLFFAVVIYMKVPRTIAGSLDKRADAISNELEQAKKLRTEAEALLVEYQRKAKAAEAEAGEIIEQAKREAAALSSEARKRTEEYVASRTKLAEQKIAQAEAQAVQEVRALSAEVAVAAAEKILAARVRGSAGDSLIARSIGDVKSKLN
ncbi:MAG: F0F1 ATP synthase subunit B [Bauldia sp.]